MTTDREMLKAAAMALGFHYVDGESWDDNAGWNALHNSADCAAMCAKLDINSLYALTNPVVSCWKEGVGDTTTTHYNENHDGTAASKETAWRYAATMVAAKIGGMK